MKLTDYQQSAARKILVYGQPKSGKTDLVGRLAETKKLWWFDLEDGIKTLLHSPRMKKEWFDNIELYSMPDTQVFPVAVETLLKVVKGGTHKICVTHGVINCVACSKIPTALWNAPINVGEFTNKDVLVIDSVSQLAASVMNFIAKKQVAADNWDWKPGWDEYAKQGFIMNRIFSILQQAPFNVVCISHEQLVEMEDKKKKIVPIGGTSEFSKTFAKFFDDVVYCDMVNKRHVPASATTYNGSIVMGSRAGKELEKMETPNLLELFK
jgi:hypothetical protein